MWRRGGGSEGRDVTDVGNGSWFWLSFLDKVFTLLLTSTISHLVIQSVNEGISSSTYILHCYTHPISSNPEIGQEIKKEMFFLNKKNTGLVYLCPPPENFGNRGNIFVKTMVFPWKIFI